MSSSSLNPLSTLTDRYEPLPSGPSGPSQVTELPLWNIESDCPLQQQRTFTDLNSLNHNPAYNLGPGSIQTNGSISSYGPLTQANGSITTYTPLAQSNGSANLGRAVPPPPPSREGTLARKADLLMNNKAGQGEERGVLTARQGQLTQVDTGALAHTSPPARNTEDTNGVALVTQQELDYNTKEDEKWWWVCCLEFCFCLL